jgi:hypothetical protein
MAFEAVRLDYLEAAEKFTSTRRASPDGLSPMQQVAIAAYQLTHRQATLEKNVSKRMISFPFLFCDILMDLVRVKAADVAEGEVASPDSESVEVDQ